MRKHGHTAGHAWVLRTAVQLAMRLPSRCTTDRKTIGTFDIAPSFKRDVSYNHHQQQPHDFQTQGDEVDVRVKQNSV